MPGATQEADMTDARLATLCAEREDLFKREAAMEADLGHDPEALRVARARLAVVLHEINDITGAPGG
jgi:hypothetical protein